MNHNQPPADPRTGDHRSHTMIVDPASVVLTAHVVHWADDHPVRTAWIVDCLTRHNAGDWGDLDDADTSANNAALRQRDGRLLSRYLVPRVLTGRGDTDEALWIITDDVSDPEPMTTVLWPSDY